MKFPECKNKDFELEEDEKKLLGKGTFGTVFKGTHMASGEQVAVKLIMRREYAKTKEHYKTYERRVQNEARMLERQKDHPNFVKLLGKYEHEGEHFLVMEYVSCDLRKFLHAAGRRLEVGDCKSIMFQIGQGVCYLHENNIMHRDLKPENVLVDEATFTFKLADFGCAHEGPLAKGDISNGEAFTHGYCAPEVMLGATDYSLPVDVWSYGCIFAEVFRGERLFPSLRKKTDDAREMARLCYVLGAPTVKEWSGLARLEGCRFPTYVSNRLAEMMGKTVDHQGLVLLKKILTYNPAKRPTIKAILDHAFFSKDFDKLQLPLGPWSGGPLPPKNAAPAPSDSDSDDALEEEEQENEPPAAKKIKLVAVKPKVKAEPVARKLGASGPRRQLAMKN